MTKSAKPDDLDKRTDTEKAGLDQHRANMKAGREGGGAVAGAVGGAAIGSIAGPPGAVVGAVIGAAAGALAGLALDGSEHDEEAESVKLDDEIGINGGSIGAPNLKHPPARVGAYSGASSGAGGSAEEEPAEGPMQKPSA